MSGVASPWYVWLSSVLVALAFLGAGTAKLSGQEEVAAAFQHFGLPPGLATFIGLCEMAGAIGLFLPRLAPVAAGGLALILTGAVSNDLRTDPPSKALPTLTLLVLCLVLLWLRRGELRA
ncbi:MAG TPA: DoxX family protein [Candidatus Dormibacteraeota bacterium]|nr:DoxX family protein [Candidatus Dormibacteraeota bacterium]